MLPLSSYFMSFWETLDTGMKHSNPKVCGLVSVDNPGVYCFVYLSYLSSGRFGKMGRIQIVSLGKISEPVVVVVVVSAVVNNREQTVSIKNEILCFVIAIFPLCR